MQAPCKLTLTGHTAYVSCISVALDGQICVTGSADLTLRVWDLHLGVCSAVLYGKKSTPTHSQIVVRWPLGQVQTGVEL
jgi:WD40 repeat protein